jgi:sugar transferase (PEP-CTERM system associated)
VEGGIILLSVLASFTLLRGSGSDGVVDFNDALVRGIVVAVFCQVCMYFLDLYDLKHSQAWGELFFSIVFAVGFVCIGIGLVSFFIPEFGVGGKMYYLTIVFIATFLLMWRIAFDYYLTELAPRQNLLIVGTGDVATMVAQEIKKRERLGFNLKGFVAAPSEAEFKLGSFGKVLGDYSNLATLVENHSIRKVVIALSERRGEYPVKDMLDLKVSGCRIVEWPGFFEKLAGRIPIDNLSPSFFIFSEGFQKSKIVLAVRRIISMILATALLVLLLPIVLIVVVLIKLETPGAVIYSQDRVGQDGRMFRIHKFRSMRDDAEADGTPRWASKDDQRVTRVGRIIRILRIDELPQLFNVLKGDLDLVGPRPERPTFVEELQRLFPYYSLRHSVKPGLTGWAQVMFIYSGTLEESKEKLQYDLFYIKNMSIKLDLLILFQTVKIVLLGRGAR